MEKPESHRIDDFPAFSMRVFEQIKEVPYFNCEEQ